MEHEAHSGGHNKRHFYIAVGVWVALILIGGYAGFYDRTKADLSVPHPLLHYRLEVLYKTLKLFVLHGEGFPEHVPWYLELARFLAPLGELAAVLLGIAAFLSFDTGRRWLVSNFGSHHVVICGLGEKGLQLVRDFQKKPGFHGKAISRVLVIEKDETNPYIPLCNQLGAVVLVGDASKRETLRDARVHRAQRLIAVCGEDGTNVEIAFAAEKILAEKGVASRLPCHVHIVDPQLRVVFQRHRLLVGGRGHLKAFIFNVAENSARLLLRDHFLDYRLPITASEDPRQAHLVIVGFGKTGESVAVEALRLTHFPNHQPLRFSVIDKDAFRARERFLLRYESFPDFCDLQFFENCADSPAVVAQIKSWCEQPDSMVTIVVCCGDDAFNLSYGLTLLQSLRRQGIPIFVCLTTEAGLGKTVSDLKAGSERSSQIAAFGKFEDSCSVEVVVNDRLNSLARKIHEKFTSSRKLEGRDEEHPSIADWDELDADLQFSNAQQAAHIPMKLRAIHCYLAPKNSAPLPGQLADDVVTQISPCDVETLAPLEHRRWWVERALSGWTPGDNEDYVERTHPDMVPWEKLTPKVKKYDVEFVKRIPAMLEDAEMLVRRSPKQV